MNHLSVLSSEALIALLAASFGWCASQLWGLHALRSQRRALKRAEARVRVQENELAEQVERALRGDPNAQKFNLLLTRQDCPNCGYTLLKRQPRCYGKNGVCSMTVIHHHVQCPHCNVDWAECTIEEKARQIDLIREKGKK